MRQCPLKGQQLHEERTHEVKTGASNIGDLEYGTDSGRGDKVESRNKET